MSTPLPLRAAAALVALEGVALVVYALTQVPAVSADRATMGVTNVAFFAVYGVGLGVFARLLDRLRSWTRAPVVLAQLIQLGVAWSFRGGSTTVLAAVLAVVSVAVLAGVFHPASLRAVEAAEPDPDA